jgi:hypothetical protein
VGSNGLESGFLVGVEHAPLHGANEPSLDDRLSQSLNLPNGKQFSKFNNQRFDALVIFLGDGLNELVDHEMNAVELSQLLQPDANLMVDDIHFSFPCLFVGDSVANNSDYVSYCFCYNISQLLQSPRCFACKLFFVEFLEASDIFNAVCERFALRHETEVVLEDVSGCLEVHHCVFTLVSVVSHIFVHELRHS